MNIPLAGRETAVALLAMIVLCGLPGDAAHGGPRSRVKPRDGPEPRTEAAVATGPAQAIACPTYWPPSQSADWDAYMAAAPAASIAILNLEVTTGYTDSFVRDLQAKGLVVIGYVETGYMAVPAGVAIDEVLRYYAAYPTIDGIFFDEAVPAWTAASEEYYTALHRSVKGMPGKTLVVLNFGAPHDEAFMRICDISLNWETTWSAYDAWSELSDSAWERSYPPDRFWHLVHHCPSDHLAEAVDKSRRNNAGYVFVTDSEPDPWGALPSYWNRERDEVQPMSRWRARNDATDLRYRLQLQNDWDHRRVYIDTDRAEATGYQVAGIGAEFLIENSGLYAYTGTGTDWSWSHERDLEIAEESDPGAVSWRLPRTALGATTATSLVFEVERAGGPTKTGHPCSHVYSADDGGIVDYGEENDSARLYFHADFAAGWTWTQVFIDADASGDTGYRIGDSGGDWLIENDDVYRYTGDGTSWSWSGPLTEPDGTSAAHHTVNGTAHDWWIWRVTIGERRFDRETNRLVLRGHTGLPLYESPVYDFEMSP